MTALLGKSHDELLVDALMRTEGKAEIIDGRIVEFMATGEEPGFAGDEIFVHLREYARRRKFGRAVSDNKGFLCNLPRRKSFSPDAAFYTGPLSGEDFYPEAPVFAVEVRSKGDYGPKAEREIAAKIRDYFAAGTQVVWDVALRHENVVTVHREGQKPMVYRRGEVAEAEPAVPGWTMRVDDLWE